MSWLIALIVGGIVGWVSVYLARPERRNYIADIVSGMAGAILGTWVFGNLIGAGGALTTSIGVITFLGVVWAVIGAAIVSLLVQGTISAGEMRTTERGQAYYEEVKRRKEKDNDRENR